MKPGDRVRVSGVHPGTLYSWTNGHAGTIAEAAEPNGWSFGRPKTWWWVRFDDGGQLAFSPSNLEEVR